MCESFQDESKSSKSAAATIIRHKGGTEGEKEKTMLENPPLASYTSDV